MLTLTQIAGFAGAGLAGAAYVPQICHLVRAHCSAGISQLAFEVWLLAALLTTARAVAIGASVFILGGCPPRNPMQSLNFQVTHLKETT